MGPQPAGNAVSKKSGETVRARTHLAQHWPERHGGERPIGGRRWGGNKQRAREKERQR